MKETKKRFFLLEKPYNVLLLSSLAFVVYVNGCKQGAGPGDAVSAAPQAKPGDVLRIGFPSPTGSSPSGPEGWAYGCGLLLPALRSQGIGEVKFIALPNGPEINEALAAKAIDLGIFGDAPAVVGRSVGIPGRVIAIGSVGANCYLVTRKDGPNTVEQLRGKTVGAAKGSNMARYLIGLLDEKGLSKDVKVVHLLQGDAEAALQRGDIAAYPSGSGPIMTLHGFKIIDQAKDHPKLTGASVTVATESFLTAHPGFPAAWNRARVQGIRDLNAHQEEYYKLLAQRARLPAPLYRKLYSATQFVTDPFTPQGIAALNGTKTFLQGQKLLRNDFKIEDWLLRDGTGKSEVASAKGVKPGKL